MLKPETLRQMWTPQFAKPGDKTGFGLGFMIDERQGHKRVGHGGAIYGFSTQLTAVPDAKLGGVVVASKDVVNTVRTHIAEVALDQMLAVRAGKPLPKIEETAPLDPDSARKLAG